MTEEAHLNRLRAEGFGVDAARYHRARPTYPAELVGDVLDGCTGTVRVLDVGCGTGRAAQLFAGRGCEVLGVEPDARMAAVAEEHGIPVEVATFEAWQPAERCFDVVISGQAWHWVDPEVGPPKAGEVLVPGGRLALFWNAIRHDAPSRAAFDAIYAELAPELAGATLMGHQASRPDSHLDPIVASGCFGEPVVTRYTWPQRYTGPEYLDLLGTHSDHRTLPASQLAPLLDAIGAAIDGLGGFFTVAYDTTLITALRR